MNGKSSIDEMPLPIDQGRAQLRAQRLKILSALLISNLAVYLLASPGAQSDQTPTHELLRHPGHFLVTLPIRAYIPLDTGANEYPAELVPLEASGPRITGAYLHPDAASRPEPTSLLEGESSGARFMLVEVPARHLEILTRLGAKGFAAFPPVPRAPTPTRLAKGGPDEIRL